MSGVATAAPAEPTGRRWPTLVALAVLTGALTVLAGPTGAVAGLATALTWYVLGTPYALAAGHVVLAAAFPDGIDAATFLLVELAFVAVLLAAVVRSKTAVGDALAVLATAAAFVGIGWLVAGAQPLWIAAGTLLIAVALAAYALHRYELVRLGLVPEIDSDADSPTHEQ